MNIAERETHLGLAICLVVLLLFAGQVSVVRDVFALAREQSAVAQQCVQDYRTAADIVESAAKSLRGQ